MASRPRTNNSRRPTQRQPAVEPDTYEDVGRSGGGLILTDHQSDTGGEVARSALQAGAVAEIKAALAMALQNPRNEDDAYSRVMKACERPTFQQKCVYKYPRGGKEIKGPSVHLSREAARVWRNFRYGFYVVWESDDKVQVRGWAWDVEANSKVEQDAIFSKLIYRKHKDGNGGSWIKPDERELRELVNKHGAIAERNCVLKCMPPYLIEDAVAHAADCQARHVRDNLDQERRNIITAFATFRVLPSQLESYIGRPLSQATPDDVVDLRQIWASIKDGHTSWSDYAGGADDGNGKSPAPSARGGVTMEDLTRPDVEAARKREEAAAEEDRRRSEPVGHVAHVGPEPTADATADPPKRKARGIKKPAEPAPTPFELYLNAIGKATDQAGLDAIMSKAEHDAAINDELWDKLVDREEGRKVDLGIGDDQAGEATPSQPIEPGPRPAELAALGAWYSRRLAVATADNIDALCDELTSDDALPERQFELLQADADAARKRLGVVNG